MNFENLSVIGTLAPPNPWDLRVGVTAAGISGKLKTNCRNGANLSMFDIGVPKSATPNFLTSKFGIPSHGFSANDQVRISFATAPSPLDSTTNYYVIYEDSNTIKLSSTAGPGSSQAFISNGTGVTVFRWMNANAGIADTLEDGNINSSPWGSDNNCGGTEISAGDDNVWKDVTSSSCTINPLGCRMRDKISGLEWSKISGPLTWEKALESCSALTFDDVTGWRLPTQKELANAYDHGIRSAASTNWIPSSQMTSAYLWTATTSSSTITNAWNGTLYDGSMSNSVKTSAKSVICVR